MSAISSFYFQSSISVRVIVTGLANLFLEWNQELGRKMASSGA
jgi:hypothetical protein